jgi:hypothetical protein
MNRLIFILLFLFTSSIPAYAQMGMMGGEQEQTEQGMMEEGQQMPEQGMMQSARMPIMQRMMTSRKMTQDTLQMMMNILDIQGKILTGVKPTEKKKMLLDIKEMKDKLQNMMSMEKRKTSGMMRQSPVDYKCRLDCAEDWLKKAIDLQEEHIKDPTMATESSQKEMMEKMENAYDCITGVSDVCRSQTKETEIKEEEKAERSKFRHHNK